MSGFFNTLSSTFYGGMAEVLVGLIPFFIGKNQVKMATNAIAIYDICGIFS
jgi:hypothetical protein